MSSLAEVGLVRRYKKGLVRRYKKELVRRYKKGLGSIVDNIVSSPVLLWREEEEECHARVALFT